MAQPSRCIEVRTADGALILTLTLCEKSAAAPAKRDGQPGVRPRSQPENNSDANGQQGNGAYMTDAQKRYLFRIMAEQGFEGDQAHEQLKSLFGTDSLQQVTKAEASRMIEQLLEGAGKR